MLGRGAPGICIEPVWTSTSSPADCTLQLTLGCRTKPGAPVPGATVPVGTVPGAMEPIDASSQQGDVHLQTSDLGRLPRPRAKHTFRDRRIPLTAENRVTRLQNRAMTTCLGELLPSDGAAAISVESAEQVTAGLIQNQKV